MNVVSRIYALLSSNQQDCKDWGGVGGLDNPGKDMGGSQRVLLKKMTRHQTHPGWDGMGGTLAHCCITAYSKDCSLASNLQAQQ